MAAMLRHWADRGVLNSYVTQTSIAHLPRERFMRVPVVVPPPLEQRAIAAVISDVNALISAMERLIDKRRYLKQAAMQQLLTGHTRLPGFSGEWAVKRLDEVVDTDPDSLSGDTSPNYSFNYIALEDVDRGVLKSHTKQVFAKSPSRARRKIRLDDVLIATVRPNLQSHLHFRLPGSNWVCSTGFCVVRCHKGVSHPGYIFGQFFERPVTEQIDALLTGSNYPAINSCNVRALEIPLPPYDEQAAIAQVLSDMETELTKLEQRLEKTRTVKQGMMQQLLTGKTRLV
jgi:type I restriction enzyme S subunit